MNEDRTPVEPFVEELDNKTLTKNQRQLEGRVFTVEIGQGLILEAFDELAKATSEAVSAQTVTIQAMHDRINAFSEAIQRNANRTLEFIAAINTKVHEEKQAFDAQLAQLERRFHARDSINTERDAELASKIETVAKDAQQALTMAEKGFKLAKYIYRHKGMFALGAGVGTALVKAIETWLM